MKSIKYLFFVHFICFALFGYVQKFDPENGQNCNFFVIKEKENKIVIENAILEKDELTVFNDETLLSYVMVFPNGSKSGEIIQKNDRISAIMAKFTGEKININIVKPDGSQKKMPDIDLNIAANTNVRINITGANGYKEVFLIEKYRKVIKSDGPVLDMFGGQITLNNGDYSFFIESMEATNETSLNGGVSYELYNDWITVKCEMPDGKLGRFVLDFGASNTTISRSLLPDNAEVLKYEVVEYSANGKRTDKATPLGASGAVENIEGLFTLNSFKMGDISLNDTKVTVLDKFPNAFVDLGIDGIIGRDILKRADFIHITNLKNENENKEIIFSNKQTKKEKHKHEVPFKIAGGYLFFEGSIGHTAISFLFDSGAHSSWISKDYLKKHVIEYKQISDQTRIAYGLDGKGIEYQDIEVESVQIGEILIDRMEFEMSNIFVLQHIGLIDSAAILGMNFLLRYNDVIFDFTEKSVMLWE